MALNLDLNEVCRPNNRSALLKPDQCPATQNTIVTSCMFEQLCIKLDQRHKMYDLTVTNFYRYQDTKPAGIDNDCKYSLQKLEYKLYNFNWENLQTFFDKCFPTLHRYLN